MLVDPVFLFFFVFFLFFFCTFSFFLFVTEKYVKIMERTYFDQQTACNSLKSSDYYWPAAHKRPVRLPGRARVVPLRVKVVDLCPSFGSNHYSLVRPYKEHVSWTKYNKNQKHNTFFHSFFLSFFFLSFFQGFVILI